ncbi:MAG: MFS transporter [Thermoplasmata archaeon]
MPSGRKRFSKAGSFPPTHPGASSPASGRDRSSGTPIQSWYYAHGLHYAADGGASPLVPLFVTGVLGGSVADVGLVSAASSMASVPASIGWGELSDALLKRKPFILVGYIGTGVLFLLMGVSDTIEQFLGLNILLGLIAAASVPVSTLLITETMDARRWSREIGIFTKLGGIGWILGLIGGGLWLELSVRSMPSGESLRWLFLILGGLSLASGAAAWLLIREPPIRPFTQRKVDKLVIFQGRIVERTRYLPLWMYRRKYHDAMHRVHSVGETIPRALRFYYVTILFLFSGFQTVYTPIPVFLSERILASGLVVFIFYLFSSVTATLMYSRAGRLIPEFGERRVLIAANIIRTGIFTGFGFIALLIASGPQIPYLLLIGLLLSMQVGAGFFWAFVSVSSTTIVSRCAPGWARGENLGLFNAIVSLGGIVGALAGGGVAQLAGYPAAFFTGAALVIGGVVGLRLNPALDQLGARRDGREWRE